MPEISRTAVTLRIFGDDLDPDEVSQILGAEPTARARKGDVRQAASGSAAVARSGSWRLEAAASCPGDLNTQISALLTKVTDDLSVWRELSTRYTCDVFCGLFMGGLNEGDVLDPRTLAALGSRGLTLGLDIYGPEA
jgi:hypothetical protein